MDGIEPCNWFAIHTKPGQEAVAEWMLTSLGLETLFPRVRLEQCLRGSWRHEVRPLFPGYLFARFCPNRHLHAVRYSRGVCRVVGAGNKPSAVEDEVIGGIRERTDGDGFVQLEEPRWLPGEAVKLQDGPLRGWSGVFERELDDGHRVAILIETINHARVIVEKHVLERATL
jgi:transcriptional antiterminator RfaH